MSEISDILKGKTKEEILKDLEESKEDFKNKDFLNHVKKIYPEKFDTVLELLPLVPTQYSIFELLKILMGSKILNCDEIPAMHATIYCFELCGIDRSNIEFRGIKTVEKTVDGITKKDELYRITIKTNTD
jgi:hypothetical protein